MSVSNVSSPFYEWEVPAFQETILSEKRSDYCVVVFVLNEGERIQRQLTRMVGLVASVDVVVADGGSTDGSLEEKFLRSVQVRAKLTKTGPGKLSAQMRMAFAWAMNQRYEGVVVIDGNDKDDPAAVLVFVEKLREGFDHVQGSRFVPGGRAVNTPWSRLGGVRLLHAPLISLASRSKQTDTTNGFRAYSRRLLMDPSVRVFRSVFDTYELHYHLAIEAGRNPNWRTTEVPVTRAYPPHGKTPTKISPVKGNLHVLGVLLKAVTGQYRFTKK